MKTIKSLLLSLIALLVVSGTSFAMINTPTKNGIVLRSEGGKQNESVVVYKLVRYGTFLGPSGSGIAPSLVSGDAVVWDTNSADAISVRTTTTSADGAFAGIVAATIVSADTTQSTSGNAEDDNGRNNWGYIAVHGGPIYANITAAGANVPAVGDMLITSVDAGKVSTTAFNTSTTAASVTNAEINRIVKGYGGFFFEAPSASATKVKVYLKNE